MSITRDNKMKKTIELELLFTCRTVARTLFALGHDYNSAIDFFETAIQEVDATVDELLAKKLLARKNKTIKTARKGKAKAKEDAPLRAAYSIAGFCKAHDLSNGMYFKLRTQGRGPVEMKVGRRVMISMEAAQRWRAAREAGVQKTVDIPTFRARKHVTGTRIVKKPKEPTT